MSTLLSVLLLLTPLFLLSPSCCCCCRVGGGGSGGGGSHVRHAGAPGLLPVARELRAVRARGGGALRGAVQVPPQPVALPRRCAHPAAAASTPPALDRVPL
eukprot:scaffold3328_cov247-Prasinococcus_capsulatus_cf.AAC.2